MLYAKKDLIILLFRKNITKIFNNPDMNNHCISQGLLDNHKIQLMKAIAQMYLKVRLHHEAKLVNFASKQAKIRSKLVKYILFNNE